ncbi:calcium-binding EGF-like domain-containing protein [Chitinophagaceae bacterium MMS25-I14]
MKFWKYTLITAFSFIGIASTVLYTACEKDSCTDLKCKNGGSCADGYCRCPTGYEGAECETMVTDRFVGRYYGTTRCDQLPGLVDTLDVFVKSAPLTLGMVRHGNITDTIYGTADGNAVDVAAYSQNNQAKYVQATVALKKFTLYVQNISDVAGNKQSVCTFVGSKN